MVKPNNGWRLLVANLHTYITHAPGYRALLAGGRRLIRLTLDAQIHDVIAANGAIVNDNIPGP